MSAWPEACREDETDRALVRDALAGRREALDDLVRRHQGFLCRLALRMVWEPRDAEDATQEILIKIVAALPTYRGESAFRTWAYRIAANHLLTLRRGKAEQAISSFECYGPALEATSVEELPDENVLSADRRVLAEEVRIGCTIGMLLCLDREQRLVFVLGEIFEASDVAGAEVLEMSRANFRQRLHRAREQLYGFMAGRCGLAEPSNLCRCARKTRGFIQAGIVDPKSLRFSREHLEAVEQVAPSRARELDARFDEGLARIYRQQTLRDPPDFVGGLRAVIEGGELRRLLALDAEPV